MSIPPTATVLEPSRPYWIIVSDEGHASIPYQHQTYESAYEESIRLAKIKPEVKFSIFKYLGHTIAEKPKVSHHTYREPVVVNNPNSYWYTYVSPKYNLRDQDVPF